MFSDIDPYWECKKLEDRIAVAVDIACKYSYIDGAHHKNWVIDQMLKALLPEKQYKKLGFDDPDWQEECIAP